jgi:ectoine hydroxylase-related dioxygenase (phytanoyl-CoA dioxygenase family)
VTVLELDDDQIGFFRAHGYLAIERITSDEEVARLRELYDRILADPRAFSIHFGGGGTLHQVMSPDFQYPELRESECFRAGRRLACRLLGIEEGELAGFFSHMIYKPPREGRDTPWHQDEAYWDQPDTRAHSLSVWVPLDPVTVESGCMQFLPGSQRGDVVRHRLEGERRPLVLDEPVDLSAAVACPLPAGGATFHHCRTLHHTGPNTSAGPRRAYSIAFHAKPAAREVPLERPWLPGFLAGTLPA